MAETTTPADPLGTLLDLANEIVSEACSLEPPRAAKRALMEARRCLTDLQDQVLSWGPTRGLPSGGDWVRQVAALVNAAGEVLRWRACWRQECQKRLAGSTPGIAVFLNDSDTRQTLTPSASDMQASWDQMVLEEATDEAVRLAGLLTGATEPVRRLWLQVGATQQQQSEQSQDHPPSDLPEAQRSIIEVLSRAKHPLTQQQVARESTNLARLTRQPDYEGYPFISVSLRTIGRLEVGVVPETADEAEHWLFPERDATGNVIGLGKRYLNGKKMQYPGSLRGLVYMPGAAFDGEPSWRWKGRAMLLQRSR